MSKYARQESAGSALFVERRGLSRYFVFLLGVMAAFAVWAIIDGALYDTLVSSLIFAGGTTVIILFSYWLFMGPIGTEGRSIRVDAEGLTVGRHFLPRVELGRVELIGEYEAFIALYRLNPRVRGVILSRTRISKNPIGGSDGVSVLVEQRRAGMKRPGWLVGTHQPEELVAALEQLRGSARP